MAGIMQTVTHSPFSSESPMRPFADVHRNSQVNSQHPSRLHPSRKKKKNKHTKLDLLPDSSSFLFQKAILNHTSVMQKDCRSSSHSSLLCFFKSGIPSSSIPFLSPVIQRSTKNKACSFTAVQFQLRTLKVISPGKNIFSVLPPAHRFSNLYYTKISTIKL